ncbi:hypothetical protein [Pseudomonas oryzihabitans]|uniref:hypothetical protein n=1 Tax=Pseudomonas oryzihabitans TaxID=47885 RepID=UPI002858425C|nr:hypothetical protein [Pseudomonas psychrotolerans]MDR6678138.1 hypothetical protein [Pseudomonas psychrotolerans]
MQNHGIASLGQDLGTRSALDLDSEVQRKVEGAADQPLDARCGGDFGERQQAVGTLEQGPDRLADGPDSSHRHRVSCLGQRHAENAGMPSTQLQVCDMFDVLGRLHPHQDSYGGIGQQEAFLMQTGPAFERFLHGILEIDADAVGTREPRLSLPTRS